MANPLNRRLAALEDVARVDIPRVLVWNARGGGDYQAWRTEHVAPLEARGYRPLIVVLRNIGAELEAEQQTRLHVAAVSDTNT